MFEITGSVRRGAAIVGMTAALFVSAASSAWAQEAATETTAEEPEKRWSNEMDLGYINTSGNSGNTSMSFGNRYTYNFTYAEFTLRADLYRATVRKDTLTNEGGGVRLDQETFTTGERYVVEAKFRQNIVGELFWYALGSWYRNPPAGLESRWVGSGGVGTRFVNNDRTVLVGEFGAGLTKESRIGGLSDTFVDLRGFAGWDQEISDNAKLALWSEVLWDIQHTDNLRIHAHAEVTSQISGTLALRLWWDLQFDNDPTQLLIDSNPDEPAALYMLKTSDRTLGASVVLSF